MNTQENTLEHENGADNEETMESDPQGEIESISEGQESGENQGSLLWLIVMSFGFTLLFTAFQTGSQVAEIVFKSYKEEHGVELNAYTGSVVLYIVFALSNWFAPSVISLIGEKFTLIVGGSTYVLYLSLFLYPNNPCLYIYSVIIGIGAAILWTAQGTLMVKYSTKDTMDRNATIFWALFQSSLIIGPLYVFFSWHGKEEITDHDRILLYSLLTAFAGGAVVIFAILKAPRSTNPAGTRRFDLRQALTALKEALAVASTRQMALLMFTFAQTGFILSMYALVLPTAVGSTAALPNAKSLVGLVGLLVGTGEIVGALSYGFLIKCAPNWSRGFIIIFACCCHCAAFMLIFLAIPEDAVLQDVKMTSTPTYIPPTETIVGFTAVLLGLGDSGFNTQIMGILGLLYKNESAPAFALYKFAQSFTAAVGFFYASVLVLTWQLLIQTIFTLLGTACFLLVEYKLPRVTSTYDQI